MKTVETEKHENCENENYGITLSGRVGAQRTRGQHKLKTNKCESR